VSPPRAEHKTKSGPTKLVDATPPRVEQKPTTPSSQPVVKPPVPAPPKNPVPPNPVPPILKDDRYVVVRNHELKTDDPAGKNKDANLHGVLANDELPSGKSYEVELVAKPLFGAFKLNRDGTFTYTNAARPGGEFVRADSFKYRARASNHEPWSEPALVTIAVRLLSGEEQEVVKRVGAMYGDAAIHMDQNPPVVQIDLSEPIVHKSVQDKSLDVLDGLVEVLHELRLDFQPITDRGLEHLARFGELQTLSLAATDISNAGLRP
jgi:hypothetical protein